MPGSFRQMKKLLYQRRRWKRSCKKLLIRMASRIQRWPKSSLTDFGRKCKNGDLRRTDRSRLNTSQKSRTINTKTYSRIQMSIALIASTNSLLIRRTMTRCIITIMTRLVAILTASDSTRTLLTILN